MTIVRSAIFTTCLWIWTLSAGLVLLPFLLAPRSVVYNLGFIWSVVALWLLRITVGINHTVSGVIQPDPSRQYIYALKHQSTWETIFFVAAGPRCAAVLKQQLRYIPIYGWYLGRIGMVPIERSAGAVALKRMLSAARRYVSVGRHLLIMPEGTRMPSGRTGRYHPGVFALYKYLDLSVIPVAHNSGLFWGRGRFVKTSGTIRVEFLEPIDPGLDKEAFMALLQDRIESAAAVLHEKGLSGRSA